MWYYVITERETNQSMINKEITKKKKFTRIITAVMAAATTSVCASARTLWTGQEITEQLIDDYVVWLKAQKMNPDALVKFSNEWGFFNTDERGIICSREEYEGANIDYWATLQKSKLCQEREGYTSILDRFSRG